MKQLMDLNRQDNFSINRVSSRTSDNFVHCSNCGKETLHELLHKETTTEYSDVVSDYPVEGGHINWLYKCLGCQNVVLKKLEWCSEYGPEDYVGVDGLWYPPLSTRRLPGWCSQLPGKELSLLQEIFVAYAANAKTLVVGGLRTLLDMFIVRLVGDVGNFKKKLEKLDEMGFVTGRQNLTLDNVLVVGNAAIHRGYQPTDKELTLLLDTVLNILEQDVLGPKVESVRQSVPSRKKAAESESD